MTNHEKELHTCCNIFVSVIWTSYYYEDINDVIEGKTTETVNIQKFNCYVVCIH